MAKSRFARSLAGVALLAIAAPLSAQAVPADILAAGYWGSDGWDDQGFPLASGTTLNKLGNGINPDGGTPPGMAFEFADIPTTDAANWRTTAAQGGVNFCNLIINGGTCEQAKSRFTANATHMLLDDPIRNPGQPGASHPHLFFGNGAANANSTFQSLRAMAARYSASSGGAFNGTAYWMPCTVKGGYCLIPDWVTFYYTAASAAISDQLTYPPLGLRYVSNFNMDDGTPANPWGAWIQAKLDAANAVPATAAAYPSGRYSITNPSGFNPANTGYVCSSTGQRLEGKIANADGTGSFSPACPSTSQIEVQASGAECWDGWNFWSPGGYKHVTPMVWDKAANGGAGAFICPNGWYRLPEFQITVPYTHTGAADYTTWKLSSDPAGAARMSTFHFDWFGAWDKTAFRMWLDNCLGINAVAHECNDATLGANFRLFTAESGLYRSPQVKVVQGAYTTADTTKMFKLPTGAETTMHMGH